MSVRDPFMIYRMVLYGVSVCDGFVFVCGLCKRDCVCRL